MVRFRRNVTNLKKRVEGKGKIKRKGETSMDIRNIVQIHIPVLRLKKGFFTSLSLSTNHQDTELEFGWNGLI